MTIHINKEHIWFLKAVIASFATVLSYSSKAMFLYTKIWEIIQIGVQIRWLTKTDLDLWNAYKNDGIRRNAEKSAEFDQTTKINKFQIIGGNWFYFALLKSLLTVLTIYRMPYNK